MTSSTNCNTDYSSPDSADQDVRPSYPTLMPDSDQVDLCLNLSLQSLASTSSSDIYHQPSAISPVHNDITPTVFNHSLVAESNTPNFFPNRYDPTTDPHSGRPLLPAYHSFQGPYSSYPSWNSFTPLGLQGNACITSTEMSLASSFQDQSHMIVVNSNEGFLPHTLGPADGNSAMLNSGLSGEENFHAFSGSNPDPYAPATTAATFIYGQQTPANPGSVSQVTISPRQQAEPIVSSSWSEHLSQIPRLCPEEAMQFPELSAGPSSTQEMDEFGRIFPCLFRAAGCHSKFSGKNEWKRHVNTLHVCENVWVCTEGNCGLLPIVSNQQASSEVPFPFTGRVFSRKDLYLSHLNRKHELLLPENLTTSRKLPSPELEKIAKKAWHRRIKLPTEMACCVKGCPDLFRGSSTWDNFLEHVADHLKRSNESQTGIVGIDIWEDAPLMRWGVAAGFLQEVEASGWKLRNVVNDERRGKKKAQR
ncbi:hypothetical protein HIM_05614 [Hirsutella minnesotensis 3608]|uniref:C2H2-type domain-containing protein n=1 Tax=Hirsutella minnesotensis 3608 TaxID=1043627 RepID=A0A0F7ZUM6_9HYPO|nr:hypothetical protein HIM_05614 [Hirsutella minnesotensis 3608]